MRPRERPAVLDDEPSPDALAGLPAPSGGIGDRPPSDEALAGLLIRVAVAKNHAGLATRLARSLAETECVACHAAFRILDGVRTAH